MHAAGAGSTTQPCARLASRLHCRGLLCSLGRSKWRNEVRDARSTALRPFARRLSSTSAAPAAAAPAATAPPVELSERTAIGSPLWQQFATAVTGEWEGVTVTFSPAREDGAPEPQELPSRYVPNDFAYAIAALPLPAAFLQVALLKLGAGSAPKGSRTACSDRQLGVGREQMSRSDTPSQLPLPGRQHAQSERHLTRCFAVLQGVGHQGARLAHAAQHTRR